MYNENPFDAEFGGIPELYLDFNNDAVKYAKRAHCYKKHPTYSLFITGVRGSGKTVFMNKVGKELNKYEMSKDNNISAIIEKMDKSKQYVNMYRTKLIKYDLIRTIIRGKLGFTLPLFREFIQAKYNELNWG